MKEKDIFSTKTINGKRIDSLIEMGKKWTEDKIKNGFIKIDCGEWIQRSKLAANGFSPKGFIYVEQKIADGEHKSLRKGEKYWGVTQEFLNYLNKRNKDFNDQALDSLADEINVAEIQF